MAKILLLNGPNLNLLGTRQPEIYGAETLADVEQAAAAQAISLGHELTSFQSNAEHELIDAVHQAKLDKIAFILINPAAFTHTSVGLRDAFAGVDIPFIEIHISNVHAREEFRRHSYFSDLAKAVICGFGTSGYTMALTRAHELLNTKV